MHNRFKRKVWAFKSDFTGALAKWLVKQSPYVVPDNLSECIVKFHNQLDEIADFDTAGMAEITLSNLTEKVEKVLKSIDIIAILNYPKTGHKEHIFLSRFEGGPENPDDDFIDIGAVARNITCEFAERADAECWLSQKDVFTDGGE